MPAASSTRMVSALSEPLGTAMRNGRAGSASAPAAASGEAAARAASRRSSEKANPAAGTSVPRPNTPVKMES